MLGSFRVGFLTRIEKNSQELIQEKTKSAFNILSASSQPAAIDQIMLALKELTTLFGIGPASASYILSRYFDFVPVMSDEAIKASSKKGAKIQYNLTVSFLSLFSNAIFLSIIAIQSRLFLH